MWEDDVYPRRHGFLRENLSVRGGIPLYALLVREPPESHETTQATTIALGCLL